MECKSQAITPLLEAIGYRMKTLGLTKKEGSLNQASLARISGVPAAVINRLFNEKKLPHGQHLLNILNSLSLILYPSRLAVDEANYIRLEKENDILRDIIKRYEILFDQYQKLLDFYENQRTESTPPIKNIYLHAENPEIDP